MMPLVEKAWVSPMTSDERQLLGDALAGCQYFDCRLLRPLIEASQKTLMEENWATILDEVFDGKFPAEKMCIQALDGFFVVLIDRRDECGDFALVAANCAVSGWKFSTHRFLQDGTIKFHSGAEIPSQDVANLFTGVWRCIQVMMNGGGICHSVPCVPTRQKRKASESKGRPVHNWVEIRLGRARHLRGGSGGAEYRGIMPWHYRIGHYVNAAVGRYWRRGCWVGNPEKGINSHIYVADCADGVPS